MQQAADDQGSGRDAEEEVEAGGGRAGGEGCGWRGCGCRGCAGGGEEDEERGVRGVEQGFAGTDTVVVGEAVGVGAAEDGDWEDGAGDCSVARGAGEG